MKAMSESMLMQCQVSVVMSLAHITIREHGDIPGQAATKDYMGCPGAVQSLAHLSLAVALGEPTLFSARQQSGASLS